MGGEKGIGTVSLSRKKRQYSVMGRARRVNLAGMIYHVLNRANFRSRLFRGSQNGSCHHSPPFKRIQPCIMRLTGGRLK